MKNVLYDILGTGINELFEVVPGSGIDEFLCTYIEDIVFCKLNPRYISHHLYMHACIDV